LKLNYDCLRKILLSIEKNLEWDDSLNYYILNLNFFVQELKEFSKPEIAYALKMGIEANLIEGLVNDCDSCILDIVCYGLTYEGHQFLDTVRENKIWEKTKKILSSIGGASLSVITSVATDCLTGFINHHLS